jgi:ubiquinone/menaquinone biosynthesis C-methylase UbiE
VDLAEYRQQSHDIWERMAAGWDGWNELMARTSRAATEQLVAALSPRPGQTVLELAAGAGIAGFAAAASLGSEGRLIMTDFASQMVETERRRGDELGFQNIDYRVMDAERMDLEDDSVDGVLCRWGYMLMADPAAALRETRRVLRLGGRLSFSVWGEPEDNPWAAVPSRILIQRDHMEPPERGAPGIFAMADPRRLEELVESAGFDTPKLEEVGMTWHFDDFDRFWRFTTEVAGAIALVIGQLDGREAAAVRAETEAALARFATGSGYDLPGVCINALAR